MFSFKAIQTVYGVRTDLNSSLRERPSTGTVFRPPTAPKSPIFLCGVCVLKSVGVGKNVSVVGEHHVVVVRERRRRQRASSSSESVVSIVRRRRIHRRVTPKQRVPTKKSAILAGKVGIGVIFGQNRQVSGRVRSFAKKPALQHRRRHRQEEPNFVIFQNHVVKEKSRGCVTPIWKFRQRFCGKSQQR